MPRDILHEAEHLRGEALHGDCLCTAAPGQGREIPQGDVDVGLWEVFGGKEKYRQQIVLLLREIIAAW